MFPCFPPTPYAKQWNEEKDPDTVLGNQEVRERKKPRLGLVLLNPHMEEEGPSTVCMAHGVLVRALPYRNIYSALLFPYPRRRPLRRRCSEEEGEGGGFAKAEAVMYF